MREKNSLASNDLHAHWNVTRLKFWVIARFIVLFTCLNKIHSWIKWIVYLSYSICSLELIFIGCSMLQQLIHDGIS